MPQRAVYPNAPIVEALIDIQCVLPGPTEALAQLQDAESALYPHKQRIDEYRAELKAQFNKNPSEPFAGSAARTLSGYVSTNHERNQVFQAKIDRFVFARLKPYPGWDQFSKEARRLWTAYRAIATPTTISRIAIRTINRLELPIPVTDPSVFLQLLPSMSSGVGADISSFFMQLQVPQPDLCAVAIITEAVEPTQDPSRLPVILDVDLWRRDDLPQDDDSLWALLDKMRHKKDDIFESCITEKTREMFR